VLGDVVISVEAAGRQAEEYGNTFYDEIALLIVHGVLHILGYDDQDEEGSALMRKREAEALAKLERR
jgi:probable rRNA maturation factor